MIRVSGTVVMIGPTGNSPFRPSYRNVAIPAVFMPGGPPLDPVLTNQRGSYRGFLALLCVEVGQGKRERGIDCARFVDQIGGFSARQMTLYRVG